MERIRSGVFNNSNNNFSFNNKTTYALKHKFSKTNRTPTQLRRCSPVK